VRTYIESALAPALMAGLTEVARARPVDPLGFLASHLLAYRDAQAAALTQAQAQMAGGMGGGGGGPM
jgi:hypothetical protein